MNKHEIRKTGAVPTKGGWAHPLTGEILCAQRMSEEQIAKHLLDLEFFGEELLTEVGSVDDEVEKLFQDEELLTEVGSVDDEVEELVEGDTHTCDDDCDHE